MKQFRVELLWVVGLVTCLVSTRSPEDAVARVRRDYLCFHLISVEQLLRIGICSDSHDCNAPRFDPGTVSAVLHGGDAYDAVGSR
jgi:hypothetical protein